MYKKVVICIFISEKRLQAKNDSNHQLQHLAGALDVPLAVLLLIVLVSRIVSKMDVTTLTDPSSDTDPPLTSCNE